MSDYDIYHIYADSIHYLLILKVILHMKKLNNSYKICKIDHFKAINYLVKYIKVRAFEKIFFNK